MKFEDAEHGNLIVVDFEAKKVDLTLEYRRKYKDLDKIRRMCLDILKLTEKATNRQFAVIQKRALLDIYIEIKTKIERNDPAYLTERNLD